MRPLAPDDLVRGQYTGYRKGEGCGKLPVGTNWWHIYGVALLAGIGFTMSLFIAGLAFSDPAILRSARLSVVVGSLFSTVCGVAVLWRAGRDACGPERQGNKLSRFNDSHMFPRMQISIDKPLHGQSRL